MSREVCAAKKHVLTEKPMAIRVEQAQAMVEAAERAGVVLQVGHSHSYDLPIARMREIVASGALGRVRMIHTWNFTDWMARPRRAAELDVGQGGGVTYRQGAHQIDILRLIGGGLVKSVRATTFDWDDSRRSIGAHTIFLNFADGAAATAVYNGYGYFSGTELIGGVGEWGEVTKPRAAPQPSAALTPEQELAAKRQRARNAIPIERAASAAFRPDHGELRARRHPPVARRAPGLFRARPRGDRAAGGQKPARPGDRGIRRRHRRQARDAHRPLGPCQSRGLHGGTENRAPAIFVARSKSMMPSAGPRSQCAFGSKSNARGSPWRRTSTLSAALLPTGTLACGRFGSVSSSCVALLLDRVELRRRAA